MHAEKLAAITSSVMPSDNALYSTCASIQHIRTIQHLCMFMQRSILSSPPPTPQCIGHPPMLPPTRCKLSFLMPGQLAVTQQEKAAMHSRCAPSILQSHDAVWSRTDMVLHEYLELCQSYAVAAGIMNAHDQCSICISSVCETDSLHQQHT